MIAGLVEATSSTIQHLVVAAGSDPLNPGPTPPPGLGAVASTWISYVKWIGIVAGILGLMVSGIMMMIGRRNRSHLAGEGAAGIPWVFAGLSVIALATGIVTSIL